MSIRLTLNYKPRFRWPLSFEAFEQKGRKVVIITDQSCVAEQPAVVPIEFMPILSCFDGQHSIADILEKGSSVGVTKELVTKIVQELENMHFLDTHESQKRWEAIKLDYRNSEIREAALAGAVYPLNPKALRNVLSEYISKSNSYTFNASDSEKIVGFIAPHIDYNRGWRTYGAGFSAFRQMQRPDVIFLFGTAHQYGEGFFHLTDKDFSTPLGKVPVHKEVLSRLARDYGHERSFKNEILHKSEHSIELQLPFIAHNYSNGIIPKIVPILVGSFHEFLHNAQYPLESNEVGDFVGALASITKELRDSGQRVLFYGGVDLAHVGQHFGDSERASDSRLEEIEVRDRQFLECVFSGDANCLLEHMCEDLDKRRICGFPSIYTMLSALKLAGIEVRGECIEYRQAVDSKSDCVVTFASAFLREQ